MMYTTKTQSATWRYFVAGRGSMPLVVLPGSFGAGEGMAAFLAERFPEYKIIAMDYSPVDTVAECLDAFDRALKEQGIESTAVYGGSFGGMLAQCWVRRNPARVTHLILAGAAAPDSSRIRKHQKSLRNLPYFPMGIIRAILRVMLSVMLRKAPQQDRWTMEFLPLISRLGKEDFASRYRVAMDFDTNYLNMEPLPASVKMLIVEGSEDKVAKQSVRDHLRSLYPDAQKHVFEGAGHSVMLTHTDDWARVIRDFLSPQRH